MFPFFGIGGANDFSIEASVFPPAGRAFSVTITFCNMLATPFGTTMGKSPNDEDAFDLPCTALEACVGEALFDIFAFGLPTSPT